jgi:selenium-binding protein 1
MKITNKKSKQLDHLMTACAFAASALSLASIGITSAAADETCQSPYMAKIVGQEDFVYVWTLGVEGVGDEQDKLVTVDVNPKSPITARSSTVFQSADAMKPSLRLYR